MKKTVVLLFVLFTLCLPAQQASAYLIDTGPGPSGNLNYITLFNLSPFFNYDTVQFTLAQPSTITSIEGWFNVSLAGDITFKIYNDAGFVPGNSTLFSQSGSFAVDQTYDWRGVSGLNWSLGSGTYWVAFEAEPGFYGTMSRPSVSPLPYEANFSQNDPGYVSNYSPIGVRIDGYAVPLPGVVLLLGAGLGRLAIYRRRNS
jgi:hypothetical protein